MSRVGGKPIPLPSSVSVQVVGSQVNIKGPKGELLAPLPPGIECKVADGSTSLERANEDVD